MEALLQETEPVLRGPLRELLKAGVPLPEVGFELQDADGAIVAEAELAWPEQRVAGLRDAQAAVAGVFSSKGWAALELDSSGTWVDQFKSLLTG